MWREGEVEFFIENHAFLLKKGDGILRASKAYALGKN